MGKRRTKRGKSARNARSGLAEGEPEELVKAPHSFVINRGNLGKYTNELMLNFRKVMEPFTASQLRVQKQNVLKDFVHMAGPLNVSHLIIFTQSEKFVYLRIAKLPRGPTITYKVNEYSLMRDVITSQKTSMMYEKLFQHHPLLVLNNFSGEGMHFKLMTTMFQNMFPSINVNKTNLNTIRRCLLLNYNNDKTIDMRQYAIKLAPTGVSKAVKKLIQNKVPNLSRFENIDEFMQKSGNLSGSEAELDTAANTVVLPQPISSRGNITSEKSAIKLFEIGPRLELQLVKIEEGLMTGEVMFHEYIKRTPQEIRALKERIKAQKLLKEERRAEQKMNIERKKRALKSEQREQGFDADAEAEEDEREQDRMWYAKEVGEEPDEDLLPGFSQKRKNPFDKPNKRSTVKRAKTSGKKGDVEKSPKEGKTLKEFLTRRKKRKETKLAKQKAKHLSQKVLKFRAQQNIVKKSSKKKGS